MSKKVWLITGAGRGMGVDFARAALAAGHSVVASGRDRERVSKVLGTSSDLLAVTLDVTSAADAEAAVRAAVDRFGRIDVLVNNAASFYAGYFEELTPEQIGQQLAASLIGPMNVTRAVLPVMRKQRSGHIISISSSAGLAAGFEFVRPTPHRSSASRAGWSPCRRRSRRSASPRPSSIRDSFARSFSRSNRRIMPSRPSATTTSAEDHWSNTGKPRTDNSQGTRRSSRARSSRLRARNHRRIASSRAPMPSPLPSRKIADLKAQIEAHRELSTSLAFD